MGDQKYLEKFPVLFKGVHVLQHLGGGVAPWNLMQYCHKKNDNKRIWLSEKTSGKEFPIVFYHFQNMRYLSQDYVNVSSETNSKITKDAIYIPYLVEVEKCRRLLKGYGIEFSVQKKYSSNKIIAFLQGTILRFKIKSVSDIYSLKKIRDRII